MAITKQKKQELIQLYVDLLGAHQAAVFVRSRGLSVAEVRQLRTQLRELGARYHVVKNTLFHEAMTRLAMQTSETLTGPISVAYCRDNISAVTDAIAKYGESLGGREFEIVGGIVEKQVLDAQRTRQLAKLPSKEILFAQILGGLHAPAAQLTGVVASSIRQVLTVLQARVDQLRESQAA